MDWKNSYHTSSDENNYSIWNFLKVCNDKGYLYKGRDSVPWCPRCGTAISQHEILTEEYKEITHKAVFVKYMVESSSLTGNRQLSDVKGRIFLLVWTTTPWTLPSNVAIAVNPDLKYGVWLVNGENLIIETTRAKEISIKTKPKKTNTQKKSSEEEVYEKSDYEKLRDERIARNNERLKSLGLTGPFKEGLSASKSKHLKKTKSVVIFVPTGVSLRKTR